MRYWECEDLAVVVLGLTGTQAEEAQEDQSVLEELLFAKLGVDLEQFQAVAEALLPFTPMIKTEILETVSNAYVKYENGFYTAIVREDVK